MKYCQYCSPLSRITSVRYCYPYTIAVWGLEEDKDISMNCYRTGAAPLDSPVRAIDLHLSKLLVSLVPITCTTYCFQG